MEIKVKNREWVKNAAIVFLAVLLVLTFFSNTIMNRSLPEAATAQVGSGSIVAKVRGTGTVTASGRTQVKATETRTIRTVMVKTGQEVNVGDVLFVLGEGDSTLLETAEETLRDLETDYKRTALTMPTYSYESQQYAVQNAENQMTAARNELEEAMNERDAKIGSESGILERIKTLEASISECDKEIIKAQEAYNKRVKELIDEIQALEEIENPTEQQKTDLDTARTKLNNLTNEGDPVVTAETQRRTQYQTELDTLNAKINSYNSPVDVAQTALNEAEEAYEKAVIAYNEAKANDELKAQSIQVELAAIAQNISIQQEKIKSLAGTDGNAVEASVSGVIDTVDCTAGDTVQKGTLLCTIEVPDMGHTVSFSVTKEQAQRLRVGDTATISNFYWGSEIVATLTSIKTDSKNPQTNKLLTFDLEGDVTSGQELTISVGQKSANYDLVVPNSSIRKDANGSFVLAVSVKSSPLGNRYIAKRVSVEVLASDDSNSAVVADLENGDFVITTSSAPVKSGDQVRMADS